MLGEGTQMWEDPLARGQFPIFGTVGKTAFPPTETRAKTLRTMGLIVLLLQWQGARVYIFDGLARF